MKPKVDKEKCIGCGMCVSLCPDTFRISSDGKAEVIGEHICNEKCNCQAAKDNCPVKAITLEK